MRNLFLMLVLVNLAFAAWHSWFASSGREPPPPASDVPSIMLASELEAQQPPIAPAPQVADDAVVDAGARPAPAEGLEPRAAESADAAAEAVGRVAAEPAAAAGLPNGAAPSSCVSVGPFRELSQAATAAANLRAGGFEPVQRAGEGEIWVGYWVYIAAIPTQAEANAILAKLRENGISDSYVIPNSDSGNLVSLGVFSEIARAGTRLTEVRELGYEATVSDRTRRATVHWVDVLLAEGQTLNFDEFQPPGRINRLEQRPCAQAYD